MTVEFMRVLVNVAGNRREATRVYKSIADLAEEAAMGTYLLDSRYQAPTDEELDELPSHLSIPGDQRRLKIPEGTLTQLCEENDFSRLLSFAPAVRKRYIGGRRVIGEKGIEIARAALLKWNESRV